MLFIDDIVAEDFQYDSPPPVFISYQWALQKEAIQLRTNLKRAGYECWLDVGQMGGGNSLFEKIDTGIREATIVVSLISEKYTVSPNCNREVGLSTLIVIHYVLSILGVDLLL